MSAEPQQRPNHFTDAGREIAKRREDRNFKARLLRRLREDAAILRQLAGND